MILPIVGGDSNSQTTHNNRRWLSCRQHRLSRLTIVGVLCFLYLFAFTNMKLIFPSVTIFKSYYINKSADIVFTKQTRIEIYDDGPHNTNFDNILYNSGVFKSPLSEKERTIQSRCRASSLIYDGADPCFSSSGTIESDTECCYCYDRYPYFVIVDEKWSRYRKKFGAPPKTKPVYQSNELRYWFCATPRNNTIDTNWTKYDNVKDKVIAVTGKFGHNDQFHDEVSNYCNSLKEFGLINEANIHCYSDSPSFVLDDTRFAKHLTYRTDPEDVSARGGGYWFHKSVLLRHHMENEEDGKYIIWADNDRLNYFRHGHFQNLIVTIEERGADFTIEELPGCPEKQWSKEDMLQAFHVTEELRESNQPNANAMVIRNSPKMRRFIDAWVDCVSNWHMVSDEESVLSNRGDFIENRHDQSLLGLLMKQFLSNDTIVGPPVRPYHDYTVLHTYNLNEEIVEQVKCPFGTTQEIVEPHNTNFDNIQYKSGIFGSPLSEKEITIQSQCRASSLIYDAADPCFSSTGIIESDTACCYCYDRYPNFVIVDEKWSTHRNKFGPPPTTKPVYQYNDLQYWFCAEPRNNTIDPNWIKYDNMKEKITVVTGKLGHNDQFHDEVSNYCNSLKAFGLINEANIHCYSDSPSFILDDPRFVKHLTYRTDPDDVSARGGGYWFYRSVLLRHHLETIDDGKYIIWADNDRLNFFRDGHFQNLMVTIEKRGADFSIEELPGCPEKQWSKEDMLQAFNVTEELRESNQPNANAMVIRNSPKMRRFIDAWVDCVSNWHMVSDEESVLPNRGDFIENRHDQSMLGLLMKQFLSNDTIVGPPVRPYHDYTVLHTYNLNEEIVEQVKCPFDTTPESIEPRNTNFDNIQYKSGIFGSPLSEKEITIQSQCRASSLIYDAADPCFSSTGIIESDTACCYCYDRYPNFVIADKKWSTHRNKFGPPPTTKPVYQYNDLQYWFCAEPRNNTINPTWTKYDNVKDKITVVTGKLGHNDQFHDEVSNYCNSLKAFGLINEANIHCYSDSPSFILENKRFEKHLKYRTDPEDVSARGGGYWFHKSVLLRHHMENIDDGQYVIWADNDRLNYFRFGHFQNLMVTIEERGADFTIEELPGCPEKQWSKEDMLQAFNVTEELRESNQPNANAMVIRNSPKMRRFIDAWVDCVSNWHMVSDEESVLPNRGDFIENRHDQSLLGLLMKQFLSNDTIVGPPVRPYHDYTVLYTYNLDEEIVELVKCPF